MAIFEALSLLALFILLYSFIIEVFTILFRLTGMPHAKAKMQVVSMLTNSGFTTNESELVVATPIRRRLAQITMFFGYSFTVIIMSCIVNVLLRLNFSEVRSLLPIVILLVVVITLIFLFFRIKPIRSIIDRFIESVGNRIMFGKDANPVVLMDMYADNAIAEIQIDNVPKCLQNVKLSESRLHEDYNIHILFVERKNKERNKVTGELMLAKGDRLLVFGNYNNIKSIFDNNPDQSCIIK